MSLSSPCCLSQLAASGVGVLLALPVFGIFAARRAPGSRLIYAACAAVCARLPGLALLGLLAGAQGGYAFEAIRRVSAPGVGPIVLLLALVGAGSKAGLVPLHAWLPLAHPAAPSHVSALMSGVMTKVAVYGFVRLVFDLAGEVKEIGRAHV